MKTKKMLLYAAVGLLMVPLATSCGGDDGSTNTPKNIAPKAELSPAQETYTAKVGEVFTIEAIVLEGSNVQHEWKIGAQVIGTNAKLEYSFPQAGTITVDYAALNGYGADRHQFEVEVAEGEHPEVNFSTGEAAGFERSIGEMLLITATTTDAAATHTWTVDDVEVSTTADLKYSVATTGTLIVKHTLHYGTIGTYTTQFTLTAIKSEYGGNRFVWRDGKDYVICLKDDLTKVWAADTENPAAPYNIETWDGSDKQKFHNGYHFGYSDGPVLEYYNFYNLATHSVLQWTGNAWPNNAVDAETGAMGADPWDGWIMDVNGTGDVRFVHFFALWDGHPSPDPYLMSSALTVVDNKLGVFSFYCVGEDLKPDFVNYNLLGTQYYEFKMIAVEDMPQP